MDFKTYSEWANELQVTQDAVPELIHSGSHKCKSTSVAGEGDIWDTRLSKLKEKKVKSLSHVWLCDPMDGSLPGSSVEGIIQARILDWAAISFSRGSSLPRDWPQVSRTASRHSTIWATREALVNSQLKTYVKMAAMMEWWNTYI